MKKEYFVGIDTSNYTTSVAVVDRDGELVANLKTPLTVNSGERGLRQSDAVFQHIKNLPPLMDSLAEIVCGGEILAIGVSERSRNLDGSYMPCFLAGVAAAHSLAAGRNIPIFGFSHQCGHIAAAIYSSGASLNGRSFAAIHASGGTTELLRATECDNGFLTELVGGTLDLNAGQVIDRVGVAMGLSFPAGRHIEELALKNEKKIPKRKPPVRGMHFNLSGAENIALSLYREGSDASLTAAFVLDYIGSAIIAACKEYVAVYKDSDFVFAGGVMCNSVIKERIKREIPSSYFAKPERSADNAVGVAVLARKRLCK